MCGSAKARVPVTNQSVRCCSSKAEVGATGRPDNFVPVDIINNDNNQDPKHSCGQVSPPGDCCSSKDKNITTSPDAASNRESPISKADCEDGCCDARFTVNGDDGCRDECCESEDSVQGEEGFGDGCCPSNETSNDESNCKSACCGPVVGKPIKVGCGIDKGNDRTTEIGVLPSSGCCSPRDDSEDDDLVAACGSAKTKIKRCTTPGATTPELDTPKAACCSEVPLPSAEKQSCCPRSTRVQASGCYSTIPEVKDISKQGCCGVKSTTTETPSQQGKTSGCCSTTGPASNDKEACGIKSPDDTGYCSMAADEVVYSTTSCCPGSSPASSKIGQGCCSKPPQQGKLGRNQKSKSSKSKSRAASLGMQEEAMCPCCVQSMLKLNLTVLNAVLSRVNEAQKKFKRCCVAFADLCCAQSKTETGCCETACQDEHGALVPHLDYSGNTGTSQKVAEEQSAEKEDSGIMDKGKEAGVEEEIVLEVIGMDCPDCLSKVTQAVRILSGAEVTNADGVRGLVNVEYDPRVIDLKAIQTFTARASGFTINVLDSGALDTSKALVLPLTFTSKPPQNVLNDYEITRLESSSRTWTNLLGHRSSDQGVQIDIILRLEGSKPTQPRTVLESLTIYGATLRPQSTDRNVARIHRDLRNIAFRTLASLILTIPILVLVWSSRPLAAPNVSHGVQLALATLVIFVAWPIYSGSFRSAYYLHRADLGVLTSFSTLTSYIFSVVAFGFQVTERDIGEPFFETVGLLITLIFAGRTLQAGTRKFGLKAVDNLGKLQPQMARLILEEVKEVDVRLLHYDDIIRIKTGEIVPTDGVVVEGHGTVDESSLTGESVPVVKAPGSGLTAGTKLQDGQLDIAVTRLVPENSISTIVDAVSSSSTGSEYQDLADRMAGWLLPIAGVCCLAAFLGWMFVERFRRSQSWGEAVISGVGYAIAIAAVSCPCALAIAVTLVTSVSMATSVQDGILFRSTQALLTAHAVQAIAFDKTGTLSQGTMTVQHTVYDQDPQSVQLIHVITAASKHPVSETAKRYIESQHELSQATKELEDIDIVPGKGVAATFFEFPVMAGNAEFTDTTHHPLIKEYLSEGLTILVITLGGQLIAIFGIKDQPRSGVNELMTYLKDQGKEVSLVSGDNHSAVHSFAQTIGISHDQVHASQTPVSKGEVVQHLKENTAGLVAFVGDGINDTIALSTADISIATGSASNASSQVIILSSDVPKAVYQILNTSRMTRNHVVVSLSFCGIYFAAAILLASGVTEWRIPPAYAGLGELVSILPVLFVGGHLAAFKSVQRWYQGRAGKEMLCERN